MAKTKPPTPARLFDEAAKRAVIRIRHHRTAAQIETRHRKRIDESAIELAAIIRDSLGYEVDDVVTDEFSNLYRVTRIHLPSFYLTSASSSSRKDIGSYTAAMGRVRVEGLLLNAKGVPVWQKSRGIRGKLSRYQP